MFPLLKAAFEERGIGFDTLFEACFGMIGLLLPFEALDVRREEWDLVRLEGL